MATIQEQLENAVAIYNKCANRVNKFINGADNETVESETGNKPTIAKIVKDTQDLVDSVTDGIKTKAIEVESKKQDVEQLKADIDLIHQQSEIPLGAIMAFPRFNLPQGFLECDGSVIQANTYPQLVAYLTGDDLATQAILPDLRGEFIRGWDNGRNIDESRVLGSSQLDQLQDHEHKYNAAYQRNGDTSGGYGQANLSANQKTFGILEANGGIPRAGSETRPRNIAMVYAIKAFGTLVNMGNLDLNGLSQEIQGLKTSRIITDDTNLFDNYCEYGWFGKISSNGGEILESAEALTAYGVWSYGNPTFDLVNKIWYCPTYQDVIGIAYKKDQFNTAYDTLEFTMRCKFTEFGSSRSQILGFGLPGSDDLAPIIRIETSTGKLHSYMSTNDTDWNVFSNASGTTVIPLDTLLDVRFSHDKVETGDIKIELSLDGLEYEDPAKVWATEITGNTTTNLHLLPDSTNAIIIGFGTDQYEYQATDLPPQEIYADYCSFKINGEELAKKHIQSGFNFKQTEEFHQVVGYKDNQLISEFCRNSDGSDALNINGDLAVVFSGFTYSNSLTYDCINYTDEGGRRLYNTYPWRHIINTKSTTWIKRNFSHFAPKNATELNLYGDVRGGVIYVENCVDNDPTKTRISELDAWLEQSGVYDRHAKNIALPYKDGLLVVGVDSYDSNNIYLFNQGFSLVRGVKQ